MNMSAVTNECTQIQAAQRRDSSESSSNTFFHQHPHESCLPSIIYWCDAFLKEQIICPSRLFPFKCSSCSISHISQRHWYNKVYLHITETKSDLKSDYIYQWILQQFLSLPLLSEVFLICLHSQGGNTLQTKQSPQLRPTDSF